MTTAASKIPPITPNTTLTVVSTGFGIAFRNADRLARPYLHRDCNLETVTTNACPTILSAEIWPRCALDRIVQDTRHRRFKPRSAVHDEQRESDEVSDEWDQRNKSFE